MRAAKLYYSLWLIDDKVIVKSIKILNNLITYYLLIIIEIKYR